MWWLVRVAPRVYFPAIGRAGVPWIIKKKKNQLELSFVWQEEVEIESKVVGAGPKGKLAMVVVEVRRKDNG